MRSEGRGRSDQQARAQAGGALAARLDPDAPRVFAKTKNPQTGGQRR